jgi:hypothetical protein
MEVIRYKIRNKGRGVATEVVLYERDLVRKVIHAATRLQDVAPDEQDGYSGDININWKDVEIEKTTGSQQARFDICLFYRNIDGRPYETTLAFSVHSLNEFTQGDRQLGTGIFCESDKTGPIKHWRWKKLSGRIRSKVRGICCYLGLRKPRPADFSKSPFADGIIITMEGRVISTNRELKDKAK